MDTVFISYSRKDAGFVRRLHDALGLQDRQVWVDWEGIAPTAEWMKEIVAAIDAATAFVFVMTPDSLASAICADELAHAARHNKRLIPIVCHDLEATSIPDSLARLNWIFFREADDFAASVQTLVTAIDTDLDWVKAHTRLLVRAREWDARTRDHSLALRGRDLQAAEQWLLLGPTKRPQPTELQTRYVLDSRKVATNRRYAMLASAMAAMIIVAILGTTTYLGRRNAARQATIAMAGRLTADAELARDQPDILPAETGWLERSVLLATEAANQLGSIRADALQTDIAMRRGLALLPRRIETRRPPDSRSGLTAIVMTEDGGMVAASKGPFRVKHWGPGGEESATLEVAGSVDSLALSADGVFLATTALNSAAGVIDLWDVATLTPMAHFPDSSATIRALALSRAATYLAASGETFDSRTSKWIDGPTRVWAMRRPGHPELARLPHATSLAFDLHGRWLAGVVDSVPRVWRAGPASAVGLEEVPLSEAGSDALTVLFSADGTLLFVDGENGNVKAWRVDDWSRPAREFKSDRPPSTVSPEGRYVAIRGGDYTARILETSEGREVARVHADQKIMTLGFFPGGQRLAVGGLGDTIDVWRVDTNGSDIVHVGAGEAIEAAAFSLDESTLHTIASDGKILGVRDWSLRGSRGPVDRSIGRPPELIATSADGRFVAVVDGQTATVLNSADGTTVHDVRFEGKASAIALSPEGGAMAMAIDDIGVLVWQTMTAVTPVRLAVRGTIEPHYLVVGPAGTTLAAITDEGSTRAGGILVTRYWEPPNETELATSPVSANRSGLISLPCALSADARYLTTNEGNGVLTVRETHTNRVIAAINHPGADNHCGFSPDSRQIATSGSGVVRVWNIATQEEVARIENAADVRDFVFSPRGRYLATVGIADGARVWLLQRDDLIEAACGRVTRNLTGDEWRDYFGDRPYRATCANIPVPATASPPRN